jgi:hypothetical protein
LTNNTKRKKTMAHRTTVGKAKHEPSTEHFTNKKIIQNKFGVLGIQSSYKRGAYSGRRETKSE